MLDDLISKLIPPEHKEEYEERAAIIEFDGGLSREDAEQLAIKLLREKLKQPSVLR
jgi:hypothetical protein